MELRILPDLADFLEQAGQRRVISVHARLRADDLTPVGIHRRLCGNREGTFLFESAEAGVWSRWSFIGVNTASTLTSTGATMQWSGRPITGLDQSTSPLEALQATLAALHTPSDPELPPFTSGLVGYLGYDMVRHMERLPGAGSDDLGVPDMVMMLASDLAVFDHARSELWLIANAINHDDQPEGAEAAWRDAVGRVQAMATRLAAPMAPLLAQQGDPHPAQVRRQVSSAQYRSMVEVAKEQILAGEVFQVVPSQRFDVDLAVGPIEIYRQLRVTNPSPYLFMLRLPGLSLVGASPEALVTLTEGVATSHPIAGTRPRGETPQADARLEAELLADEKENAEHLMLVDLARNDLGRVCLPGTVAVTEFRTVRRYSHVMHLESQVSGAVRPGISPVEVVMACFPAGTLSGAPKVRAMELIDSLEPVRRGPYGGVVGYFDLSGNADMAITIRSAVVTKGVAHVQAGAGVVADSVPAGEDAECQAKARAMLLAIDQAAAMVPWPDPDQTAGIQAGSAPAPGQTR